MNWFEKWYCGSALWRYLTRRELLPWMLQDAKLGEHILEIGAGPGAATIELARHAPRVTSLEYDHALALSLIPDYDLLGEIRQRIGTSALFKATPRLCLSRMPHFPPRLRSSCCTI